MLNRNETAHRGDGGQGRKNRGERFISYPQYTPKTTRVQSPLYRVGMGVSLLLADAAEALAGAVWRWSIGA